MKQKLILLMVIGLMTGSLQPVVASELLEKARGDYEFQLDRYREFYEEYLLKKGQFQNVPTFAHQEELVLAAKIMLVKRDDVWWTYWQALRTDVVESMGFKDEHRQELIEDILIEQAELKQHQSGLQPITEKGPLLEEATKVNLKRDTYTRIAYTTLADIRVARLRNAIVELIHFTDTVKPLIAVQIRDPQVRSVRQRGINEVYSLLEESETMVNEAEQGNNFKRIHRADNAYGDLVEEMYPAYSKVNQSYHLLVELSEGLDL